MVARTQKVAILLAVTFLGVGSIVAPALGVVQTNSSSSDSVQASVGVLQQGDTTNQTNATKVGRLHVTHLVLNNVTVTRARFNNATVTNATSAEEHEEGLASQQGNVTRQQVVFSSFTVRQATLENVTMTNLTIRNESTATALLGNAGVPNETANISLDRLVLSNETIEGVVVHSATVDEAIGVNNTEIKNIVIQEPDSTETQPVIEINAVQVQQIENVTITNRTGNVSGMRVRGFELAEEPRMPTTPNATTTVTNETTTVKQTAEERNRVTTVNETTTNETQAKHGLWL